MRAKARTRCGRIRERAGGGCETREPVAAKAWGVVWIEGGPMDEIGLAEKSPPETGGWGWGCEKLPI